MLPGTTILPILSIERLHLRWLVPRDVPALFSIFGDADVCRYWSSPPPPDVAAAAALLADIVQGFETHRLFQWGVARRDTGEVIGTCTLAALSAEHRRAELGFALGRPHWGLGFMAEALPALHGRSSIFQRARESASLADSVSWWVAGPPEVLPFAGTWLGLEGIAEFQRRLGGTMCYDKVELRRYIVGGDDGGGTVPRVPASLAPPADRSRARSSSSDASIQLARHRHTGCSLAPR